MQDAVQSYEVCIGTRSMACDTVRWTVGPAQNWLPFTLTPGVLHLFTVRAISAEGPGPFAAELRVSMPRLAAIPDRSDATGTAVAVDVAATDPDGSGVTFTATNLPAGMSIDGRSGRLSGTPSTSGLYRPSITVSDALASDTQSFAWTITTVSGNGGGGSSGITPMTSVAVGFSSSTPQAVGTAVAITARGQGGNGTPMYRFWVQPWGGAWQVVQDWSAASTYTWRLPAAGGYNVTVYGRNGTAGNGDVSASRTFEAVGSGSGGGTGGGGTGGAITAMTSVALSFAPTTPQPAGTAVTISARGQGGSGAPMYRFLVQPWGGAWQVVQEWSTSASVSWRPAVSGGYNLTVYARNGTIGTGDVTNSRTFEASAGTGSGGGAPRSPMTSIALTYTPTTPQPVGTNVTLTAQGRGGTGTPTYRFWVQPWGGAWQIVQDWSTSSTLTWRPAAIGGYNLTVYGRTGATGDGDVSDSKTFEAKR
ncbi:MAG: putative Ig domain-containing protein [Acidobacteriota bacterium]